jgi:TPR repeat protein
MKTSQLLFLIVLFSNVCNGENIKLTQGDLVVLANNGNIEAMYQIFIDIASKHTPEKPLTNEEIELARKWLIKAGENNSWRAAYVLELCYREGCWGVEVDESKAEHYKNVFNEYKPKDELLENDR